MASQTGCRVDHLTQNGTGSSETGSTAEPSGTKGQQGQHPRNKVRRPDVELVLPALWCSAHRRQVRCPSCIEYMPRVWR